jgi:hypothetical protein
MILHRLLLATASIALTSTFDTQAAPAAPAPVLPRHSLTITPEGAALETALTKAEYRFTPEVRAAYLALSKAKAKAALAAANQSLPADFLAWVDSDPVVEASVYGAKQSPANILRMLRSLELDLGKDVVRKNHTQLALAAAVTDAKDGPKANLSAREPFKLIIPSSPRKPVNTNDPSRPLDVNDHIINFLNQPLKPEYAGQQAGPGVNKRTFPPFLDGVMTGADVMANKPLQAEFNDYMAAHGQTAQVNCETPRRQFIPESDRAAISAAYKLFLDAYTAKGLIPPRDRPATLVERCAFLIRNDAYRFPKDAKQVWPKFPLNAPWPLLTMLVQNRDPLREAEDIWQYFRETGNLYANPAYMGWIAQVETFLRARSIAPLDFGYHSVQMMVKDGGVCGVIGLIQARSYLALGIPTTNCTEPNHCGVSRYVFNPETNTYSFSGGYSENSLPFSPWAISEPPSRKKPVYFTDTALALNYGVQSYLDSTIAHGVFSLLSEADQKAHGMALIESGLEINPYNILLTSEVAKFGADAQLRLLRKMETQFVKMIAANKPGCPADTVCLKRGLIASLAKGDLPADKAVVAEIHSLLRQEKSVPAATLARYQSAAEGLPVMLATTEAAFRSHLAATRNPDRCAQMTSVLTATAQQIQDPAQRKAWAQARLQELNGREAYLDKNSIRIDSSSDVLAKLAEQKARPRNEQIQPVLDGVTVRLQANVAGKRNLKDCQRLAEQLTAIAPQIKDSAQRSKWREILSQTIAGKETFQITTNGQTSDQRDPCADTIANLPSPSEVKK